MTTSVALCLGPVFFDLDSDEGLVLKNMQYLAIPIPGFLDWGNLIVLIQQ